MPDNIDESEANRDKANLVQRVTELEEALTSCRQIQEKLRASEERYFKLFNNANDLIHIVSPSREFLAVNRKWLDTLEYVQEDIKALLVTDILREDERQKVLGMLQRVTKGESVSFETVFISKSGKEINVEGNGSGIFHDGKFISAVGIFRDISERKKTEAALRVSEQFMTDVFESVQDGISVLNSDLTILHVNGIMNEWYKENLPLEGRKCYEAYHNSDKHCEPCPSLRCMETGSKELDIIAGVPGSPIEWVEIFSYPIKDPNSDEVTGVVEFIRDITKRMQDKNALKESETRLNVIFEAAPDAYYISDFKGTLIDGNRAAEELLGYPREELIGKTFIDAGILSEDSVQTALDTLAENIKGNPTGPDDFTLIRKDGTEVKVEILTHPVKIAGEDMVLGIARDITEQVKLQQQLRQAHKMESVGRLAGGVAHDFNNMLSVIFGNIEIALEKVDPDQPLYTYLAEIRLAAKRSAGLTRQLLAFARKQTITPKVLDINETVESMLKMLRRLIGENIDLAWIPGTDVWPIRVDPSQIDQIMANLCVNARDAIDDVGRIAIETGNITLNEAYCTGYPGMKPGEFMLLTMSDDGCGMNTETLGSLFEPFFTTKEMGKGTGLGLAMVYGIVKQNDGYISVYSEPGYGTTFRIYLPRHAGRIPQIQIESPEETTRLGHETVLVVEDEPLILKLITKLLEQRGHFVMNATTPGEAIRLAGEYTGEIHLLITDVVMPEMNGRDLSKNLQSIFPNIKCLFMSGYTANVIAHQGVLDEGVNFIQKPFSNDEMVAMVCMVLDSE